MRIVLTWGAKHSVRCAAVGLAAEPKVLALVQGHFLWHFPYLERIQGVLDGVPRGPVGPPGPLELAALAPHKEILLLPGLFHLVLDLLLPPRLPLDSPLPPDALRLGSGRIVASEIEAPNTLAIPV